MVSGTLAGILMKISVRQVELLKTKMLLVDCLMQPALT